LWVLKKKGKLESVFIFEVNELIHMKLKNIHVQSCAHFMAMGFGCKQVGTIISLNFLE
jgi:hypothetical protein